MYVLVRTFHDTQKCTARLLFDTSSTLSSSSSSSAATVTTISLTEGEEPSNNSHITPSSSSLHQCIILGLPREYTEEDLRLFIEPYLGEVLIFEICDTHDHLRSGRLSVRVHTQNAIDNTGTTHTIIYRYYIMISYTITTNALRSIPHLYLLTTLTALILRIPYIGTTINDSLPISTATTIATAAAATAVSCSKYGSMYSNRLAIICFSNEAALAGFVGKYPRLQRPQPHHLAFSGLSLVFIEAKTPMLRFFYREFSL